MNRPLRTPLPLYPGYGHPDWVAGGLFAHDDIVLGLHDNIARYLPGEPPPFRAVFGGLPSCLWHAGRIAPLDLDQDGLPHALELFRAYNRRGIAVRFTFTAWDLPAAALGDRVGNTLLEMAVQAGAEHGVRNGAIVTDDGLEAYIRRRFPALTLTCSSIKAVREHPAWTDRPDWYNAMARRFDYVVLRPSRNFDDDFLAALEPKARMEILVNNICRMYCPHELRHMGMQRDFEASGGPGRRSSAALAALQDHEARCMEHTRLDPLDSVNCSSRDMRRLTEHGFSLFKLAGRECPAPRFLWFLSMYLFEPGGAVTPLMPLFSSPLHIPFHAPSNLNTPEAPHA